MEKWKKLGLFPSKAKLLLGLHSALSLSTRIMCVLFFLAPSLGLFGLTALCRHLTFASPRLVFDVSSDLQVTTVSDAFPRSVSEDCALANAATLYVFLLFFVPFLGASLYLLKWAVSPAFHASSSLSAREGIHQSQSVPYPTVF